MNRPTAMVAPHPIQSDPPEVAASKRELRDRLRKSRSASPEISARIVDRLRSLLLQPGEPASAGEPATGDRACVEPSFKNHITDNGMAAERIACVWPLADEVDLRALCLQLHEAGRIVLLPETPPRGEPLQFRRWHPGCVMQAGRFGTMHPDGPEERPDLVLVPLLGFDRRGNRLGYGGGYYDRTLAALPDARSIGYATAASELAAIPAGPHDRLLHLIVTEMESISCDDSST